MSDLFVSGYFYELSPIKALKDKKRKYFNFSIKKDETLQQGVSSSPDTYELFSGNAKVLNLVLRLNDCTGTVVTTTIISLLMAVHLLKNRSYFERKTLQANIFTIQQGISKCDIFDLIDLTFFIYNLQQEVTHEKN